MEVKGCAKGLFIGRLGRGCANAPLLAINGDAVAVRPFAVVAERRERRGRARGHGRAGGGRRKWPAVVLCRMTGGAASIRGARGAGRKKRGGRRREKGKEKKKERRKEKEKREEKKKGGAGGIRGDGREPGVASTRS